MAGKPLEYQRQRAELARRFPGYRFGWHRGGWRARWKDAETGREGSLNLHTPSAVEAERVFAEYLRAWERLDNPEGKTVGDIFTAYMENRRAVVRRFDRIECSWKALEPEFADLYPSQITEIRARDYDKKRSRGGIKPGTIRKDLEFLRAALRWGLKKDMLEKVPHIWIPPPPKPNHRHLTKAEARRLTDACRAPHVRLFVTLALATAGRRDAILGLTWDRVDFVRERIDLREPGERMKGRAEVPMNARAETELKVAHAMAESKWVIEYNGGRVHSIKTGLSRAVAEAGVAPCSAHTLRHTSAVWMAEAGRPMSEIAQYLGHTDSRLTEAVYARFSPEYLKEAAGALDW